MLAYIYTVEGGTTVSFDDNNFRIDIKLYKPQGTTNIMVFRLYKVHVSTQGEGGVDGFERPLSSSPKRGHPSKLIRIYIRVRVADRAKISGNALIMHIPFYKKSK